jgi:hypothetical protein
MSKDTVTAALTEIPLNEVDTYTRGAVQSSIITEREFRLKYAEGSEARASFQGMLTAVDRSMTLKAFQDTDLWKQYAPEYFLSLAPQVGLQPKRASYWNLIYPNSVSVDREPYVWLGAADHSDPNKRARWQFITESNKLDQKTSTYLRRDASLREFGHAAAWSNNLLSDSPLSVIENHMQKMTNKLTVFLNDWAVAELNEATTGKNASIYNNVFTCEGTETSSKDAAGVTKTTKHPISADDLLKAINQFRAGENEDGIDGVTNRGVDYYVPTYLLITPTIKRLLAMELYRMGYRMTGDSSPAAGVRQTALLSDFFEIPVIVFNPKRWDDNHSENFVTDNSAYIVDTDYLATVNHKDGWKQLQWNDNANDKTIIAVRKRADFLVQDNLAVYRLDPADVS